MTSHETHSGGTCVRAELALRLQFAVDCLPCLHGRLAGAGYKPAKVWTCSCAFAIRGGEKQKAFIRRNGT